MSIFTCAICHKDHDSDWVGCHLYGDSELICDRCDIFLEDVKRMSPEEKDARIKLFESRIAHIKEVNGTTD